ncbi:hypothetical protein IL38_24090 [Actinopolyspora erythraea]|uniref:Uncharacterized protein n=1 Tax=Actinopolyspora erythraea TaxID=414996 RepID=A0ABR4WYC2_9ACTN|nr:hypothetical protein [Actinopolyspora erythraea]KGI79380.1 hypothetical protein IL38_24090 [Actinopolyspora erythraea]
MAELWPGGPISLPHQVTLDGVSCTIPELDTATVVGVLARGAWWEIVPNALPDDERTEIARRLDDDHDPLEFEHLWLVATTVLARLSGATAHGGSHGWHSAQRIAATMAASWIDYVSWCATKGFTPLSGPVWQTIGSGLACLRESQQEETDLTQLEAKLFAPGPQPSSVPRHTPEEEARAALAALDETLPGEDPGGVTLDGGWAS